MPADLGTDAARMAGCALIVAVGAIPVGLASRLHCKKHARPILLRPRLWSVPWNGFEVLLLFFVATTLPSTFVEPLLARLGLFEAIYGNDPADTSWLSMRSLWAAAVFAPFFAAGAWLLLRFAHPEWKPERPRIAPGAAAAVGTWLVLHPLVAAIHFVVAVSFDALGWAPDLHPLEKAFQIGRPRIDEALLVVQAAIATPIVEEVLFRGLLMPWLLGPRYRRTLILLFSFALAAASSAQQIDGRTEWRIGPILFAGILTAIGLLHQALRRKHARAEGAMYASATLFAVVHSTVWPTPIPLFFLGVGLGWLALRTRGVLAPIIVHSLFNAVSVLFVLRA